MSASSKAQVGNCKLTGTHGKLVKSHLIPRALTPPRIGGKPFAEFGGGARPSRRFDSWYDPALVTQKGEDILTSYDTFAIAELRSLKLLWQSFGPMLHLATSDYEAFPDKPHGIRRVTFTDAGRMRLFFLSLLWRTAATNRREFAEVSLRPSVLRRLRSYVRDQNSDVPLDFFPTTLTQISTRGLSHNYGVIAQTKSPVTFGGYTTDKLPIFRFFLDGLIVHMHCSVSEEALDGLSQMLVGPTESTTLSTVTWEASWQARNLALSIYDTERMYPGAIGRAEGRRSG